MTLIDAPAPSRAITGARQPDPRQLDLFAGTVYAVAPPDEAPEPETSPRAVTSAFEIDGA
jgi:hypothetical protein